MYPRTLNAGNEKSMTEFEIRSKDIDDYDLASPLSHLRSVLIRGSVLFGLGVAAMTLVVVPAMQQGSMGTLAAFGGPDIDRMTTGSITGGGQSTTYRVHRSILQSGSGPCLMWPDGRQQGAC
ncbi:hypothetical protein FP2506_05256 [Fulvimarina pelagi HTCC2506]|uniref:Uncharacterized protein n=2 Tax=Fulvimarina pelagi TaxID=217511 RepID=Q0G7Z5_9HYPH|nr:hypothetical protein FP2506_05256 [Fulvimarina pelagi HTCC2506]